MSGMGVVGGSSPRVEAVVAAIEALARQVEAEGWSGPDRAAVMQAFRRVADPGTSVRSRSIEPNMAGIEAVIVRNPDSAKVLSIVFDPWTPTGQDKTCPTCKQKLKK